MIHSFKNTKEHKKLTIKEWKLKNEFNLSVSVFFFLILILILFQSIAKKLDSIKEEEVNNEGGEEEEEEKEAIIKIKELSCEMCLTKKATIECIHCQILYCEEDCEKAHSLPSTKNHNWFKLVEMKEEEEDIGSSNQGGEGMGGRGRGKIQKYCNFHPMERYKMFCSTCNSLVCILCVTDEHFGHKCLQLNSTSEKIYSEISIQYELLKERNLKYLEHLNYLEKRLKLNFEQKIRMKLSIKKQIKKLISFLEFKENELIEEIENSKEIEEEEEEFKIFKEFSLKSTELLKKSEKIFSLNHSSFLFILEGLNLTRKLENSLSSNNLILKKSKENLDKILEIEDQFNSISNLILTEPLDFQSSFISSSSSNSSSNGSNESLNQFKGEIEEGIQFDLNIFNKKGKLVSKEFLDLFQFSIDIISKPTENTITNIEKTIIGNGHIFVHLKGDHLGEYNLRVHIFDNEIKGSPLVAEISNQINFKIFFSNLPLS